MQKILFATLIIFAFTSQAQEAGMAVDEKPLPSDKPAVQAQISEDELFERPKFQEITPKAEVTPAPRVVTRAPAAAVVPQRFVDKEMNIACYYLAPADSNGVVSMYAAINCVKLDDPQDKLDREQERMERQSDRAKEEAAARAQADRESYDANQKALRDIRSKKTK